MPLEAIAKAHMHQSNQKIPIYLICYIFTFIDILFQYAAHFLNFTLTFLLFEQFMVSPEIFANLLFINLFLLNVFQLTYRLSI